MIEIVNFDKSKTQLLEIIQAHFETKSLEKLHIGVEHSLYSKKQDQGSSIHKKFYQIYQKDDTFLKEYDKFIKTIVKPRYNEPVVYQTKPTFRIHMPGNVAVGEFHKDRDYSHSPNELNYWLPFTKTFDTNTIWIESQEDKKDYKPYNLEYGQILIFDGSNLTHGNKANITNFSRVSIDFRIMPLSLYDENNNKTSTHLNIPMKIGNYYSLME